MSTTKAPKNKTPIDPADVLGDARQLYETLAFLVRKIDNERKRGTPLYPLGGFGRNCIWDENYPRELAAARHLVKSLKRKYGY
jgi:hypothetical protein